MSPNRIQRVAKLPDPPKSLYEDLLAWGELESDIIYEHNRLYYQESIAIEMRRQLPTPEARHEYVGVLVYSYFYQKLQQEDEEFFKFHISLKELNRIENDLVNVSHAAQDTILPMITDLRPFVLVTEWLPDFNFEEAKNIMYLVGPRLENLLIRENKENLEWLVAAGYALMIATEEDIQSSGKQITYSPHPWIYLFVALLENLKINLIVGD